MYLGAVFIGRGLLRMALILFNYLGHCHLITGFVSGRFFFFFESFLFNYLTLSIEQTLPIWKPF